MTHVCVGNLAIIGSDKGLSPGRRQAIILTSAGILLIGPLGANFSEILIEIHTISFKKIHLKMSSGKWRPFCLGLNELKSCPFALGFSVHFSPPCSRSGRTRGLPNRFLLSDGPNSSFEPRGSTDPWHHNWRDSRPQLWHVYPGWPRSCGLHKSTSGQTHEARQHEDYDYQSYLFSYLPQPDPPTK